MTVTEQVLLPPIFFEQQRAIDAALDLTAGWDKEASRLRKIADYTRIHGTSLIADRYAMRAHALTDNAQAVRDALELTGAAL